MISQVNQARPQDESNSDSIIESVPDTKVNESLKAGTTVPFPRRRSNKNLTYEQQILRSLREVLSEDELVKIKDQILEDIKKFEESPNLVIVEENLPRKNHNNSRDNFRGSKYRGPSKNRKKWQVMKMIKKETVRIGAIKSELEAARIYDFLAILTEGLNVSKL